MNDLTITCPHCKKPVKVTELLAAPLVDHAVAARLSEEKSRLEAAAESRMRTQLSAAASEIALAKKELADAMRRERELITREKELNFEVEKKVRVEVKRAEEEAAARSDSRHQTTLAERDNLIHTLREQTAALQRKIEQGSQQAQGEVVELHLETSLRSAFANDNIVPVPKGVHGGDVVQAVFNDKGGPAGSILWECKNTKSWSDGWVAKLKQDAVDAKANLAIIATASMPKNTKGFTVVDGVWVVSLEAAMGAAYAARQWLMDVARVTKAVEGPSSKAEALYSYMIGPVFRGKLQQVMSVHAAMRDGLEKERRAIQKQWSIREEQIGKSLTAIVSISGEVQGISGKSIEGDDPMSLLEDNG